MEAIGFAASIATLAQIVISTIELTRRFKDAPQDLERIALHLQLMSMQIRLLDITTFKDEPAFSRLGVLQMKGRIENIRVTIDLINHDLEQGGHVKKFARKLHWAILDKPRVKVLMDDLRHTESTLGVLLGLMLSRRAEQGHEMIWRIETKIDSLVKDVNRFYDVHAKNTEALPVSTARDSWPSQNCKDMANLEYGHRKVNVYRIEDCTVSRLLPITGTVTTVESQGRKDRTISFFCHLPFNHIINFDISLRSCWVAKLGMNMPMLKTFVSEQSEFLQACARGDVLCMKMSLDTRPHRWYDVVEGNLTPMYYAIESGNVQACRFLLNQGADVNSLFGRDQTSPLSWAFNRRDMRIARLFLEHGADITHISALGWSPVFYLWDSLGTDLPEAIEYLTMLQATPGFRFSHQGLVDPEGCSLLHRVVALGTARETEMVVRLEADLNSLMGPLAWNPLQTAAYYGRLENLKVLWPYYSHLNMEHRDLRGWTLLHIAASAGHSDIVQFLLDKGANWEALSIPSWTHMPEELYGRCCTPAEVARAQSFEREQSFLLAVENVCGPSNPILPEIRETWYDAEQGIAIEC